MDSDDALSVPLFVLCVIFYFDYTFSFHCNEAFLDQLCFMGK